MRTTIKINDLTNLIAESVRRYLNEAVNVIDNFQLAKNIIDNTNDDNFYYIEIIKRKKDNPFVDFGGKSRTFINYYVVTTPEELDSIKAEIISICQKQNARAYFYVNSRSKTAVDRYTNYLKKKGRMRGYEFQFAAGQHKEYSDSDNDWETLRPMGIIDIDSDDTTIHDKTKEILKNNNLTPHSEYRTANGGLHIVMPDRQASKIDFSEFDNGKHLGRNALVHFNGDAPIILYSAIDTFGYDKLQHMYKSGQLRDRSRRNGHRH